MIPCLAQEVSLLILNYNAQRAPRNFSHLQREKHNDAIMIAWLSASAASGQCS